MTLENFKQPSWSRRQVNCFYLLTPKPATPIVRFAPVLIENAADYCREFYVGSHPHIYARRILTANVMSKAMVNK